MEYLTDGGRAADGAPEGGIYRAARRACRRIDDALAEPASGVGRYGRLTLATRDDLAPPGDAARDVLVIDFAGFESESFQLDSASRIVSEAVRLGWRNIVGYDFIGGPRYVGTNLAEPDGAAAPGVVIELYGREFGDFIGALLEGAEIWVYGQGQSHLGMKADSGYLFVLQDVLNTCMYAAHGGTISLWDSGSRFAVAGQNKVLLADGKTPAPGLQVDPLRLAQRVRVRVPDVGRRQLAARRDGPARSPTRAASCRSSPSPTPASSSCRAPRPAACSCSIPQVRLDPAQYHGNVLSAITPEEWARDLGPFIAARGAAPRRCRSAIEGEHITVRLEGEWRRWRYDEAFAKLIPIKVAKAAQQKGIVAAAAGADRRRVADARRRTNTNK